jgi:hypothetical protein
MTIFVESKIAHVPFINPYRFETSLRLELHIILALGIGWVKASQAKVT